MALSGVYPATLSQARYEETYTSLTVAGFPGFSPGDVSIDNMGGQWVFCLTASACAAHALCTISQALVPIAAEATTTTIADFPYKLGIPQVAVASGSYGWFWRGPGGGVSRGIKVLAANATLGKILYTTATAGVVDDANVDESVVSGLTLTATVTTQAATECSASIPLACNLVEPD